MRNNFITVFLHDFHHALSFSLPPTLTLTLTFLQNREEAIDLEHLANATPI